MTAPERAVLAALPLSVWAVDLDGRITLAPPRAGSESVTGRPIAEVLADAASPEQVAHAMETLRAGRSALVTWEFSRETAEEERSYVMHVAPMHKGHAVAGYVFTAVDVTANRRSRELLDGIGAALARTISVERALQELSQQLRLAMSAESIAIAVADERTSALALVHADGFDEAEDQVDAHFRATWLDTLASARVHSRSSERGLEVTAPIAAGGGVIGAITVVVEPGDAPQHLAEARRVIAAAGAALGIAIERARLVRRAEHRRRLEAAGGMAASVAHELRNPLSGISSAAQLLRYRATEDPVVEKNVGRILREIERLNGMAASLLEYGRPAALRLAPGEPEAVWDEVLGKQRGRLESRALELTRHRASAGTPLRIDAAQLAQVFTNILLNAVDAAPEGSDLTLTSTALANGGWRCELRNAGPPMAPDVLSRAFELSFSAGSGGPGLGLALCQRIVEEHGGTISLESSDTEGTTATIVLPGAPA